MASDNPVEFKPESITQIGILVKEDPEEMAKEWERLFGVKNWRIIEIAPKIEGKTVRLFKLALADLGGVEIELAQPLEGDTYHKQHVETHGNTGLHHLMFTVEDVAGVTKHLEAEGGEVLYGVPGCSYIRFEKAGGVIIELIPKR